MGETQRGVEFRIMPNGGDDNRWYWEVLIGGRMVVTRGVADNEPAACQEASDAAREATSLVARHSDFDRLKSRSK
jgi:hypothetical protein